MNWYDVYYEVPIRTGDVVFDGIPPFVSSTLTITIDNPGLDAAIGGCFIGKSRTLGSTKWGMTGGVLSYSSVTTDKFGNVTILKRENAKRLNFEVLIPEGFEGEAYRLLRLYTDVKMVVIGSSAYSMSFSYGFIDQELWQGLQRTPDQTGRIVASAHAGFGFFSKQTMKLRHPCWDCRAACFHSEWLNA